MRAHTQSACGDTMLTTPQHIQWIFHSAHQRIWYRHSLCSWTAVDAYFFSLFSDSLNDIYTTRWKEATKKKLHTPHLMHFCHVNISIYIANIDNVLETVARPCEYSAFHSIIFTCKWTFMNVHKHLYDAISLHLSENYCRKIATLINSIQFHPGKNSSAHNKIKFKCDKIHFEYFLNSVQC